MNVYQKVRERDSHRCRVCGYGQTLAVHHIVFRSHGGPDKMWNLITVCKACHDLAHGLGDTRIYRWELQALLDYDMHNLSFMRTMMRANPEGLATCRSCMRRSEGYVCVLWEQTVAPDYGCDSWRIRDF